MNKQAPDILSDQAQSHLNRTILKLNKRLMDSARHSCHNAGHDDQRDTVSDTVFIDLFTQPHQERRTCRQSDDDNRDREKCLVNNRASEQTYG